MFPKDQFLGRCCLKFTKTSSKFDKKYLKSSTINQHCLEILTISHSLPQCSLLMQMAQLSSCDLIMELWSRKNKLRNMGWMVTPGTVQRCCLASDANDLLDLSPIVNWHLVNDLWPLLSGCYEQFCCGANRQLILSVYSVHSVSCLGSLSFHWSDLWVI